MVMLCNLQCSCSPLLMTVLWPLFFFLMICCCCCVVLGCIGRAFRFGVVAVLGGCCTVWRQQRIIVYGLSIEVICDGARARANSVSCLVLFRRVYTTTVTPSSLQSSITCSNYHSTIRGNVGFSFVCAFKNRVRSTTTCLYLEPTTSVWCQEAVSGGVVVDSAVVWVIRRPLVSCRFFILRLQCWVTVRLLTVSQIQLVLLRAPSRSMDYPRRTVP